MLPLVSRIKLSIVVAGDALESGDYDKVSQWLRLGARVADEIDEIMYDIEKERKQKEDDK